MTATIQPPTLTPLAPEAEKPERTQVSVSPQTRLWTRSEFERASDLGLFGPEERLELIEGEIIVKVTQNSPHTTSMNLTAEALRPILTGLYIRIQQPLNLGASSQPEPDIAFVEGSIRDYAQAHPTTAVLIVEISDSTLAYDRRTKAGLYARAGVGEYWIVNLIDRVLEVHRQPAPMTDVPLGHGYRSIVQYTAEETIRPLAAPEQTVAVAALLP